MGTSTVTMNPLLWGVIGFVVAGFLPMGLARVGTIIGGSLLTITAMSSLTAGAADAAAGGMVALLFWMVTTFSLLELRDRADTTRSLLSHLPGIHPTAGLGDPSRDAGTGGGTGPGDPPADSPTPGRGRDPQGIAQLIDGLFSTGQSRQQPSEPHGPGAGGGPVQDEAGQPPQPPGPGQHPPHNADDQGIVPPDDDALQADVEDIDAFRQ